HRDMNVNNNITQSKKNETQIVYKCYAIFKVFSKNYLNKQYIFYTMNQKHIGIIILILGIIFAYSTYVEQKETSEQIQDLVLETGSCFQDDGTCLHEESSKDGMIGWIISTAAILFGLYIGFIDKTQKVLQEHQVKVSKALEESKRLEKEKDEFQAYVSAFTEEEQRILKAVREQDGIKQSTLRYRADMSKTTLSLILKSLEERKVISRKTSGKTNEVYLVKKF
ncbi:hypothetical protein KY321_05700, partial [Candidatus Woesearchaeota archaeon]|nr:hypothetical protein [Candidatus Woesearchaeota archaeon]